MSLFKTKQLCTKRPLVDCAAGGFADGAASRLYKIKLRTSTITMHFPCHFPRSMRLIVVPFKIVRINIICLWINNRFLVYDIVNRFYSKFVSSS